MTFEVPGYGPVEDTDGAITASLLFAVRMGLDKISGNGHVSINYEYFDIGKYEVSATIDDDYSSFEIDSKAEFVNDKINITILNKSREFSSVDPFEEMASWMFSVYNEYLSAQNEPIIW